MEAISNSVEDYLVDGLSFKLGEGASYINERKMVTYHPSGSNIYRSESGTKLIRIDITGDQWLDPNSVRVQFTLRNNDADVLKLLRPLGSPWGFFRRLRVLCGGQVVEDIDNYNRCHEMFQSFKSHDVRNDESCEAFGYRYDDMGGSWSTDTAKGLPGNTSRTVSFKLMSGLLSQPKFLPLKTCKITIELELCNSKYDPIFSIYQTVFTAADTSEDWSIENVQLKADLIVLDNSLDNSYTSHLSSGKTLPINFSTFIASNQTVVGNDIGITVSRAITRLRSVYISLFKGGRDSAHKSWNEFYHPMASDPNKGTYDAYNENYELVWQLSIGSKLFPEYPCEGIAESYSKLKRCVEGANNSFHSLSITPYDYMNEKFIIGIDTEKIVGASFSGMNTAAGQMLNMKVKAKNASAMGAIDMTGTMHVVLYSDQILEIRDTGIEIHQ
jgi:hypothetical protein